MAQSEPAYEPKRYWESRLTDNFDLRGVGHSAFSPAYNKWLYRRKRRCIDDFFEDRDLNGSDVLDIGCGTGFFVEWYLSRGARVTGVDITSISVERLSARFDATFHVADVTDPAFPACGPFDIVNMWDVIYHIVDPDAFEHAISNIAARLKPGGLFLFTDWFGLPMDREVAAHVRARCLATYRRALPPRGLELLSLQPLYTRLNKRNVGMRADDRLGPLYFFLDNRARRIATDNLSLSVWRRLAEGAG